MKRKIFLAIFLCLVSLMMSICESEGQEPPLSSVRVTGEILAGGVGAIAGLAVGVGAGTIISKGTEAIAPGPPGEFGSLAWGLIGGGAGLTLGSTFGVYMVGNIGDETGDFMTTWTGSVVGAILGGAGAFYVFSDEKSLLIGVLVGSTIGATIAFNLTRERESRSQMSRAAPIIYLNLVRTRF